MQCSFANKSEFYSSYNLQILKFTEYPQKPKNIQRNSQHSDDVTLKMLKKKVMYSNRLHKPSNDSSTGGKIKNTHFELEM